MIFLIKQKHHRCVQYVLFGGSSPITDIVIMMREREFHGWEYEVIEGGLGGREEYSINFWGFSGFQWLKELFDMTHMKRNEYVNPTLVSYYREKEGWVQGRSIQLISQFLSSFLDDAIKEHYLIWFIWRRENN